MLSEKFSKLINYLSTCNGTCDMELQAKVDAGELTPEEAAYVGIYAKMQRLSDRVTKIADDTRSLL